MALGRAGVGTISAARAPGCAKDRRFAVHTFASCAPPEISLPADGALPLGGDAFLLQREAPAAARQAHDRGLPATHTTAGSAPGGVAPAVERASCLATWLADGAIVLWPAPSAGCAEPRLQPRATTAPVASAVGAAAPLRIAPAVELALSPGPVAAGLLSGAALLGATPADLEAGFRGSAAAPGTQTLLEASGMALTVAAISFPLLRGVSERHDRPPRSARVAGSTQA